MRARRARGVQARRREEKESEIRARMDRLSKRRGNRMSKDAASSTKSDKSSSSGKEGHGKGEGPPSSKGSAGKRGGHSKACSASDASAISRELTHSQHSGTPLESLGDGESTAATSYATLTLTLTLTPGDGESTAATSYTRSRHLHTRVWQAAARRPSHTGLPSQHAVSCDRPVHQRCTLDRGTCLVGVAVRHAQVRQRRVP